MTSEQRLLLEEQLNIVLRELDKLASLEAVVNVDSSYSSGHRVVVARVVIPLKNGAHAERRNGVNGRRANGTEQ